MTSQNSHKKKWLAKMDVSITSIPPLDLDSKFKSHFKFKLCFRRK